MTTADILNLPMTSNDSGATSIKGYLLALLAAIWREREGFSGKRPFGNGGWQYDLYRPLLKAGLVSGKFEGDGSWDVMEIDHKAADALILNAIIAMAGQS